MRTSTRRSRLPRIFLANLIDHARSLSLSLSLSLFVKLPMRPRIIQFEILILKWHTEWSFNMVL